MTSTNSNSFIINYHDACIYEKDLNLLLSNTEWLNDACIHYQMKRLEYHRQSLVVEGGNGGDSRISKGNDTKIAHVEFVDPSIVSYFMHQLDDEDDRDEMIVLVQSWKLLLSSSSLQENGQQSNLIFIIIPINDNNSESLFQSGNHWSLLIAIKLNISKRTNDENDKDELMFFHFDSSQGYNTRTALAVSKKIQYMYSLSRNHKSNHNQDERYKRPNVKKDKKEEKISVTECNVPQQKNGHDCGIHTLFHAQILGMMDVITFDGTLYDISIERLEDIFANQFQQCIKTFLLDKYHNDVNEMTKSLRTTISQDIQNLRHADSDTS
jgi:Ulp1 family protease